MNPANLTPERRWVCPNCPAGTVTRDARPHTPFHACAGLRGLTAPFVAEGVRCKVETRDRDDWVGKENVQTDGEGRPVMAIVTTRDDGQDCAVLAPCATGTAEPLVSGHGDDGPQIPRTTERSPTNGMGW